MTEESLYPSVPILMVDDEAAWLRSLALTLKDMAGINNSIKCTDSRDVMKLMAEQEICLVLLDLTMPHISGTELLAMLHRDYPDVPVIVISGMNQVETAINCIKQGAFDYYVKSAEKERLLTAIQQAFAFRHLKTENIRLQRRFLDPLSRPEVFNGFQTRNHRMRAIFQYLEAVAGSGEPILITGESGTGKELVARAFHQLCDPDSSWVAVNAAGLDDNHFSDTLFGHTRGAFTSADRERSGMIAKAEGGTLFLDEIGDLSQPSQIKLLRLLQEGEYFPLGSDSPRTVGANFVFATNVRLEEKVNRGDFRKDLYYRLKAHHVELPPLRERLEDLPLLLEEFFTAAATKMGKNVPAVPRELVGLLATYDFPGNVRELRAMAFNAISLHKSHRLSLRSFREAIANDHEGLMVVANPDQDSDQYRAVAFPRQMPTLEELGEQAVREAMERAGDNQTLAASLLGITRQALSKRLQKLKD